jgi:hypothetical protein
LQEYIEVGRELVDPRVAAENLAIHVLLAIVLAVASESMSAVSLSPTRVMPLERRDVRPVPSQAGVETLRRTTERRAVQPVLLLRRRRS